jgi:hypothetical protein
MPAKRKWNKIIKLGKTPYQMTIILYPVKLTFGRKGEIKVS